jgi:sulfide dehydrogenase [flavocytochrome c] flavoprotein subunit
MDRRNLLGFLGASVVAGTASRSQAQTVEAKKVVVVGGGMAGVSAAKYLKLWGQDTVDVTLVAASDIYLSHIMSNKVLTGELNLVNDLAYNYDNRPAGVTLVVGTARTPSGTGSAGGTITIDLKGGGEQTLAYDRLVLAPGIDFDFSPSIYGSLTQAQIDLHFPHALQAGDTTLELARQLAALKSKTVSHRVIVTIPKAPYRCPPGPYERVCAIAGWLKVNSPKSKVIVLDANPNVIVEPLSFGNAFTKTFSNYVEYYPSATVKTASVDGAGMKTIVLTAGVKLTNALTKKVVGRTALTSFMAKVANIIPTQRAGKIVIDTFCPKGSTTTSIFGTDKGLFDNRWALIDEKTYKARHPDLAAVHVIGDSIYSYRQPKAGHIGNQQAKVCADAILRELTANDVYPTPITNSACYTPITPTTATWLTAVFQYKKVNWTINSVANEGYAMDFLPPGAPVEPSGGIATATANEQMNEWFSALMSDAFGQGFG